MGHRIWDSIAYLSGVTALNPGDLIFTGTNHQGLGPLQDGDDVRLEIETVGTLCVRVRDPLRSEEHTSELQSLMRISYAVFCLKKKKQKTQKYDQQAL